MGKVFSVIFTIIGRIIKIAFIVAFVSAILAFLAGAVTFFSNAPDNVHRSEGPGWVFYWYSN